LDFLFKNPITSDINMGHCGVPKPPEFVNSIHWHWVHIPRVTDPNSKAPEPVWRPQWYFLLGPPTDPAVLASILGRHDIPKVFRANTLNSYVKLWGDSDLPALIWNGRTQYRIHGVAYETESPEESQKLDEHLAMGGMYKKQIFGIFWEERPRQLPPIEKYGVVFFWNGDMSLLREGNLPPGMVDEDSPRQG
jgi:hypothetical protein